MYSCVTMLILPPNFWTLLLGHLAYKISASKPVVMVDNVSIMWIWRVLVCPVRMLRMSIMESEN